tara:strand:+ start:158 stop:394 length:237 start_codon:yes stop_codon:yes gene_type:complete
MYINSLKTTKTMEQFVELILWEQVRLDCKYPKEDNNNGYTYGLEFADEFGEIIDVQWFKNDQERFDFVKQHDLTIIND